MSVTSELGSKKIRYSFYHVRRTWIENKSDEYELPNIDKSDWLLISDMFNFNNYTININKKCNIILDLAHCSFKNFVEANKLFARNKNLKLTCISFGKGKYHRLTGGGGMGFTADIAYEPHYKKLYAQSDRYDVANIPKDILRLSKYSSGSTRVVLSGDDFSDEYICDLRKSGFDISDGLFNHITHEWLNEYYLWKKAI